MTAIKQALRKSQKTIDREPAKPNFPSARYFQIHFQHMEAQLDLTQRCLEALQQQIAELQMRLGSVHAGFDLSKIEK